MSALDGTTISDKTRAILEPDVVESEEDRGPHIGSWIGAMVCAAGISASFVLLLTGATLLAQQGGWAASGGPYAIEHPITDEMWVFPVGMVGMFLFPMVHKIFASRIHAPGLLYATWCAAYTLVGGLALWIGLRPPGGQELAWGYVILGAIFLTIGVGSIVVGFLTFRGDSRRSDIQSAGLPVYWVLTAVALVAGAAIGLRLTG